ncbi:MAG: FlgD immunoglobulin-like domain containing protein [Candidatus Latescibacterota bacterium]
MGRRWVLLAGPVAALVLQTRAGTVRAWEVRPADYEWSVTVTAVVEVDGIPGGGPGSLLAAFAGQECRGLARPVETLERWLFFLTVYAHGPGEEIVFRVDLDGSGALADLEPGITIQADAVYGDPLNPLVLEVVGEPLRPPVVTGVASSAAPAAPSFGLDPPSPNPFRFHTRIPSTLAEAGWVDVGVRNVLGQRVRRLTSGPQAAGRWVVGWDGRDEAARRLPPGLYLCWVRAGGRQAVRSLVLGR